MFFSLCGKHDAKNLRWKSRLVRLESLEERQLLTAVGFEGATESRQIPYGPVFCTAYEERCESAIDLATIRNETAPILTTGAEPLVVSTNVDDAKVEGSLRWTINNAADGDTIKFSSELNGATITLNGSELSINKSIMIDASDLPNGITISANGKSRVLNIAGSGVDKTKVEIIGVTVADGYYRVSNANGQGGGIYVSRASVSLRNSTVGKNVAESSGWFTTTSRGGGIYAESSALTLTNASVVGNSSKSSLSSYGGGIYAKGTTVTLTNAVVAGNSLSGGTVVDQVSGGGIFVENNSTLTLTNATVAGNSVGKKALWDISSGPGGIVVKNSTLTLKNTIVASNNGGNVSGDLSEDSSNNLTEEDGSIIFTEAPAFNNTGALTNPETFNLALKDDSVAIDVGENAFVEEATDLDGNWRIRQGKDDSDPKVDIGAYEHTPVDESKVPLYPAIVTASGEEETNKLSLRNAIQYVGDGDKIEFDNSLTTIMLAEGEILLDKNLTINATGVLIDANGGSRIFNVASDVDVEINGGTFINGKSGSSETPENGGAIYNDGNLTLNGATFQANEATKNGGAIFNDFGATLTINGGCFSSNSANNGGAFANYGTLEISDSEGVATTISENSADCFGGAYFGCDELTVGGKTFFMSNDAGFKGGAIYNDVNKSDVDSPIVGVVTINGDDVSFVGNTAGERGGAIQTYSTLNIGGTATFSGNKASGDEVDKYGGAIDVGKGGSATLSGALTFNGNAADFGGAIFSVGALTFQVDENDGYCYTFTDNSANKSGGAIDALAGTLSLGGSFTFIANEAKGDHDFDSSGVGGAIATAATTIVSDSEFVWKDEANPSKKNSAAWGNCVAFKNDCGISVQTFGLDDAMDYVIFNELVEKVNPSQSLLPRSISPNAVEASITVEGVKTTFGAEGVTPQQLGLGVGTYEALVQYVDANGETSAAYILKLTVAPGASVEVRETVIADGKGVKFDFNLNKECGRAVSVWEISWGDGSTTRAENLSESWRAAHYYAQDGTFDVSLKVVYIDGTSETFEAFSTQKIGTTVAKTEALSAVFEDVDDLFEDAFVDFENPNVYEPAFLR